MPGSALWFATVCVEVAAYVLCAAYGQQLPSPLCVACCTYAEDLGFIAADSSTMSPVCVASQALPHTSLALQAKLFLHLVAPHREFQGKQAKQNKGEFNSLKYNADLACGGGMEVVTQLLFTCFGSQGLASMGFKLSLSEVGSSRTSPGDIEHALLEESEWLRLAVSLAFSLAGRRALSLQACWSAFLGKAAQLLSDDPEQVQEGLAYWRDFAEDWKKIIKKTGKNVRSLVQRSFASTPIFNDFMEQLSSTSFTALTNSLKHNLLVGFSISQTLAVENYVKAIRTVETRSQENKQVRLMRRWMAPLQRKVAASVFKYKNVDYTKQVLKGHFLKKKSLPKRWFHASKKKASLQFSPICGTSPKVPWPTFNAQSQKMQYADVQLLRSSLEKYNFSNIHLHWLCLACPPMTVFRPIGTEQWWLSLSCLGVTAVLACPARVIEHKQEKLVALVEGMTHKDLKFIPILDLDAVEAQEVQWRGPLYMERQQMPAEVPLVCAQVLSPDPLPLCELAAKKAFFNLGPVWLNRLCTHYRVDVPSGAGLVELLDTLIHYLFPSLSDEAYLEILSNRVRVDSEVAFKWGDVELGDIIEAGDEEEVSKEGEREKLLCKRNEGIEKEFHKLRKQCVAKKQAQEASGQKRKRGAPAPSAASASASSKAPARMAMPPLANAQLPKDEAVLWLPDEEVKVHKDGPNGGWRVLAKCPQTVSHVEFPWHVVLRCWIALRCPSLLLILCCLCWGVLVGLQTRFLALGPLVASLWRYFDISRSFIKYGGDVASFAIIAKAAWEFRCKPCPHKWIIDMAAQFDE